MDEMHIEIRRTSRCCPAQPRLIWQSCLQKSLEKKQVEAHIFFYEKSIHDISMSFFQRLWLDTYPPGNCPIPSQERHFWGKMIFPTSRLVGYWCSRRLGSMHLTKARMLRERQVQAISKSKSLRNWQKHIEKSSNSKLDSIWLNQKVTIFKYSDHHS